MQLGPLCFAKPTQWAMHTLATGQWAQLGVLTRAQAWEHHTVRSKVRLSIFKMTFCSTQMDTASYEHGDESDFLSCVICIACMLYTYLCMFPVCRYVHVWYMCMHMCMAAGE